MPTIRGCHLPEDLYYNIDKHVWARIEPDGTVTVGMTDVAQSLAGKLLYANTKPVGMLIPKGKSVCTVESGKFVGPVPNPFGGEIVAVNEKLKTRASLINEDCYGEGWIVRIRPSDLEGDKRDLLTGQAAVEAYRAKMEAENIQCDS